MWPEFLEKTGFLPEPVAKPYDAVDNKKSPGVPLEKVLYPHVNKIFARIFF